MSDPFILIFWVEGHASGRYRVLAVATGAGGHTFGAIEDALAPGQARSRFAARYAQSISGHRTSSFATRTIHAGYRGERFVLVCAASLSEWSDEM